MRRFIYFFGFTEEHTNVRQVTKYRHFFNFINRIRGDLTTKDDNFTAIQTNRCIQFIITGAWYPDGTFITTESDKLDEVDNRRIQGENNTFTIITNTGTHHQSDTGFKFLRGAGWKGILIDIGIGDVIGIVNNDVVIRHIKLIKITENFTAMDPRSSVGTTSSTRLESLTAANAGNLIIQDGNPRCRQGTCQVFLFDCLQDDIIGRLTDNTGNID